MSTRENVHLSILRQRILIRRQNSQVKRSRENVHQPRIWTPNSLHFAHEVHFAHGGQNLLLSFDCRSDWFWGFCTLPDQNLSRHKTVTSVLLTRLFHLILSSNFRLSKEMHTISLSRIAVHVNCTQVTLVPLTKLLQIPVFYYRKRGSASYIVREVLLVRERDTEKERERDRRKWRHHCRAKIGDEFTPSLAKNSHNWRWAYTFPCQKFALFVSPFTLPVSLFTERSPWWRWNSQWVHTFHCQKIFRPQALFPLFQMARAARRVIENPRQMIKSCPVLFCSSHRKTASN